MPTGLSLSAGLAPALPDTSSALAAVAVVSATTEVISAVAPAAALGGMWQPPAALPALSVGDVFEPAPGVDPDGSLAVSVAAEVGGEGLPVLLGTTPSTATLVIADATGALVAGSTEVAPADEGLPVSLAAAADVVDAVAPTVSEATEVVHEFVATPPPADLGPVGGMVIGDDPLAGALTPAVVEPDGLLSDGELGTDLVADLTTAADDAAVNLLVPGVPDGAAPADVQVTVTVDTVALPGMTPASPAPPAADPGQPAGLVDDSAATVSPAGVVAPRQGVLAAAGPAGGSARPAALMDLSAAEPEVLSPDGRADLPETRTPPPVAAGAPAGTVGALPPGGGLESGVADVGGPEPAADAAPVAPPAHGLRSVYAALAAAAGLLFGGYLWRSAALDQRGLAGRAKAKQIGRRDARQGP